MFYVLYFVPLNHSKVFVPVNKPIFKVVSKEANTSVQLRYTS